MKRNQIIKIADHESLMKTPAFEAMMFASMMGEDDDTPQYLNCVAEVRIVGNKDGTKYFGVRGLDSLLPMDFLGSKEVPEEEKEINGFKIGDFVYVKKDATPEELKAPPEVIRDHMDKIEAFKTFTSSGAMRISAIDHEDETVRIFPVGFWVSPNALEIAEDVEDKVKSAGIELGQDVTIKEFADEIMLRNNAGTNEYMDKHLGEKDKILSVYPSRNPDGTASYDGPVIIELENAPGMWIKEALEI